MVHRARPSKERRDRGVIRGIAYGQRPANGLPQSDARAFDDFTHCRDISWAPQSGGPMLDQELHAMVPVGIMRPIDVTFTVGNGAP
jgi:hypothetical protein